MILALASASPRRAELLRQIGLPFRQFAVHIDETPLEAEPPRQYVQRLALEKARAGMERLRREGYHMPVLGCDTAVVVDGEIHGKPRDTAHARHMLHTLSGRSHQVMSGVALCAHGQAHQRVNISTVSFRYLNDAEINLYLDSGEPFDKAGAYAIQGRAALFVQHLEGSYSGVMGLPVYETGEMLVEAGFGPYLLQRIPPGFPPPPDVLKEKSHE